MKPYKYILLDWDGNLAKTLDIWLFALKTSLEKREIYLSDKEIGADFKIFEERMVGRGIKDIDAILNEANLIAVEKVLDVELYPNAKNILTDLRKASKYLALVTTSRHDLIDALLKKHEMQQSFDFVVCGDDTLNQKPDPEPLLKALDLLGASDRKGHAVMVGDSNADINAARQAGIDSILFYPPEHKVFYDIEELRALNPTHIISDFRELLSCIEK